MFSFIWKGLINQNFIVKFIVRIYIIFWSLVGKEHLFRFLAYSINSVFVFFHFCIIPSEKSIANFERELKLPSLAIEVKSFF